MYIIKDVNERYFVQWIGSTPIFSGNQLSAKVFNEDKANKTIKSLNLIVKGNYKKVICDENFIKKINRDNPEWYRQQIETLLNKYKEKSESMFKEDPRAVCKQVAYDLQRLL